MTQETLDLARGLKAEGYTWGDVAEMVGVSMSGLQQRLGPVCAVDSKRRRRDRKFDLQRRFVPAAVLAERAQRLAVEPTINQLLLGDPLPGRSALDQRGR